MKLKKLTSTHKTELFILALAALFDLSFGIERLLIWKGMTIDPLWSGLLYLGLGLIVTVAGVYNLIKDVKSDCGESDTVQMQNLIERLRGLEPLHAQLRTHTSGVWSEKTLKLKAELEQIQKQIKELKEKNGWD
jgi:hypothetical protein